MRMRRVRDSGDTADKMFYNQLLFYYYCIKWIIPSLFPLEPANSHWYYSLICGWLQIILRRRLSFQVGYGITAGCVFVTGPWKAMGNTSDDCWSASSEHGVYLKLLLSKVLQVLTGCGGEQAQQPKRRSSRLSCSFYPYWQRNTIYQRSESYACGRERAGMKDRDELECKSHTF